MARPNVAEDTIEGRECGLVQAMCVSCEGIGDQDHLIFKLGCIANGCGLL